jgi:diguanylate cyclase (GGDEF)-like protein
MISFIQSWIIKKLAIGGFSKRRDVVWFALTKTVWTTLAAIALNAAVYTILSSFLFTGVAAPNNLMVDSVVTACVAGPISFLAYYLVGAAIFELAISRNEFERLSRIDPLTGLMNRRAFVEVIAAIDNPYVLVLFDIDRFKAINDTYGHPAGDDVLVEVSQRLRHAFGAENTVARLGGEEFGVVLRQFDKEDALDVVNGFREDMASQPFHAGGHDIAVTISAGVSQGNGKFTYSMLLTNADKALYLAKASGRNRVVHADELTVIQPPGRENNGGRVAI